MEGRGREREWREGMRNGGMEGKGREENIRKHFIIIITIVITIVIIIITTITIIIIITIIITITTGRTLSPGSLSCYEGVYRLNNSTVALDPLLFTTQRNKSRFVVLYCMK